MERISLREEEIFIPTASRMPSGEKIESSFVKGIEFFIASKTPPDLLEGPSFRKM